MKYTLEKNNKLCRTLVLQPPENKNQSKEKVGRLFVKFRDTRDNH
jgi:hypothetical protein